MRIFLEVSIIKQFGSDIALAFAQDNGGTVREMEDGSYYRRQTQEE